MALSVSHHPVCQGCGAPLSHTLIDLGHQPLANSYLEPEQARLPEPVYPLHVRVCDHCLLVQADTVKLPADIFSDYAYFSSFSDSWLQHCKRYVTEMSERFSLGPNSRVVEVASNDGYLLQYFLPLGIPVKGIEPAKNIAASAIARGVPTEIAFFGQNVARKMVDTGWTADLLIAKNVLAHVNDINDFVAGVSMILKRGGVFTVEFPHLLNLIRQVQFDTIYHEHFMYLSLLAVKKIFERHALMIFDVQKQPTHGGSLRLFVGHIGHPHGATSAVQSVLDEEVAAGLDRLEGYKGFEARAHKVRQGLLNFLGEARAQGKRVVAYGAAAKGSTLLNYCGVKGDDILFVVDRNPAKQNLLLPGSRIPIRPVEELLTAKPDHVLILPWNLTDEIVRQLPEVFTAGGDFVTAIPELRRIKNAV